MIKCAICERLFIQKSLDDPLHSTNWNLPNRKTFDVCSELCKDIVFEKYEIGLKIVMAKDIASVEEKRLKIQNVKDVLDSYLVGNHTPDTLTDIVVNRLYYALNSAFGYYDSRYYDD